MQVQVFDSEIPALVAVLTAPADPMGDFAQSKELSLRAAREGAKRGIRCIHLQVFDPGYPPPNAMLRKDIGEFVASLPGETDYAMVTDSVLLRGVLTVVSWFRPAAEAGSSAHATVDEAIRWFESRRGTPLPRLREMYREARAGVAKPKA